MLTIAKVNGNHLPLFCCPAFSNFVTSRQCVYEKLEKEPPWWFWPRPGRLLTRHSFSTSEMSGLLCHVIVVNVEQQMLLQWSLSGSW